MDARYQISFTNTYTRDADAVVKAGSGPNGISIAHVLQERASEFTLCSDVTAIISPGNIRRTIIVNLTADFLAKHPDYNSRYHALLGAFKGTFNMGLPATVLESVTINPGLCPP